MRKLSFIFATLLLAATMHAQELKTIKLNTPDKNRGSAVMKALSDRHSDREYAAKELSLQVMGGERDQPAGWKTDGPFCPEQTGYRYLCNHERRRLPV